MSQAGDECERARKAGRCSLALSKLNGAGEERKSAARCNGRNEVVEQPGGEALVVDERRFRSAKTGLKELAQKRTALIGDKGFE